MDLHKIQSSCCHTTLCTFLSLSTFFLMKKMYFLQEAEQWDHFILFILFPFLLCCAFRSKVITYVRLSFPFVSQGIVESFYLCGKLTMIDFCFSGQKRIPRLVIYHLSSIYSCPVGQKTLSSLQRILHQAFMSLEASFTAAVAAAALSCTNPLSLVYPSMAIFYSLGGPEKPSGR